MRIQKIIFKEFRNYKQFNLDELGELTLFIGSNAVGKTNILEGIQLLTSAQSFRHPLISQFVRKGASTSHIELVAKDNNRYLTIELIMESGKRRYLINGKTRSRADVRGILPSIIFTPDDLQLVKKSSMIKRAALDDLGIQLTRNYSVVRQDYEKAVRYKNKLLRDDVSNALLESINEVLITCGAQLFCLRRALFQRIIPHVCQSYQELAGESAELFTAILCPSWDYLAQTEKTDTQTLKDKMHQNDIYEINDDLQDPAKCREILARELERWVDKERKQGRSLIGPHHDKITFMLNGNDASMFASQGQQRSIVLAWKLAEANVIREVLGESPILLLDDVFSELDGSRRERLVSFVTEDIQTFITATDLSCFSGELVTRARVVNLPLKTTHEKD